MKPKKPKELSAMEKALKEMEERWRKEHNWARYDPSDTYYQRCDGIAYCISILKRHMRGGQ